MQMLAQLADSGRRDEVGELSRNFSVMLETIGSQLEKMQADKEQIVSLLGSRQEFYNNMTHELKTPLTTIQGYAQLMEADRGADPKLTSQGLSQILQESTRMHRMVLPLLPPEVKKGARVSKLFSHSRKQAPSGMGSPSSRVRV